MILIFTFKYTFIFTQQKTFFKKKKIAFLKPKVLMGELAFSVSPNATQEDGN